MTLGTVQDLILKTKRGRDTLTVLETNQKIDFPLMKKKDPKNRRARCVRVKFLSDC